MSIFSSYILKSLLNLLVLSMKHKCSNAFLSSSIFYYISRISLVILGITTVIISSIGRINSMFSFALFLICI